MAMSRRERDAFQGLYKVAMDAGYYGDNALRTKARNAKAEAWKANSLACCGIDPQAPYLDQTTQKEKT